MQFRVAILGYGNLGKAVEKEVINDESLQLVGIFCKRTNVVSEYNSNVYSRRELVNFKDKIDVLVLCSGSQTDMLSDAPRYTQYFNTINTFDTHALIPWLYKKLNAIAKISSTVAIVSAGWDPGLFSYAKATFSNIFKKPCTCFWGKGVSLGHSQAVKGLENVQDAISFTLPNPKAQKQAENGEEITQSLHSRKVYVVSTNPVFNDKIKQEIINMPNYFLGQNVSVVFVSQEKIDKLKTLNHKGEVICCHGSSKMKLSVDMQSNPQFTARIVYSYIKAFENIRKKYGAGAYTPLHFSPLDLSVFSAEETIKRYC